VTSERPRRETTLVRRRSCAWAQISSIGRSHFAPGTAYLSPIGTSGRFPSVYHKTTDYGRPGRRSTATLRAVVRESPREPRLLFAGTRATVYVSSRRRRELAAADRSIFPASSARSLNQRASGPSGIATHGRSFWILDDLALLEALARDPAPSVATCSSSPRKTAWLTHAYGGDAGDSEGENPPTRDGFLQRAGELRRQDAAHALVPRRERSDDSHVRPAPERQAREEGGRRSRAVGGRDPRTRA